jgi:hypothetical protein
MHGKLHMLVITTRSSCHTFLDTYLKLISRPKQHWQASTLHKYLLAMRTRTSCLQAQVTCLG